MVLGHGRQFGLRILVETGTYLGAMVDACKDAFTRIYSIELDEGFYRRARRRFARFPHVKLLCGDSGAVLPTVLQQISERCLFWLDAHYVEGLRKGLTECPLLQELELIGSHPVRGHVVLIDDARFFQGRGDWPSLATLAEVAGSYGWACEVHDDVVRLK
jgi:hypothetical protein